MSVPEVLLLARRDIARLMRPADYVEAVERGFRAGAAGTAASPPPMHIPAEGGGFHAKGASMGAYVALKFNGNFPGNPERRGLPTIQGALILSDAGTGALLALMDSIEVTLRRTAAASALAARLLARPESETLLICGCGAQGRAHLAALADVPSLKRCFAWDADRGKAAAFAREMDGFGGIAVEAVANLAEADVVVTCTTARAPFLDRVAPGTFVVAVGADSPDKNELAPALLVEATIVTDSTEQCLAMGDLRHAVGAGARAAAELGEILAGRKPGRRSRDETIVFDSTGTAVQDVVAAAAIYERARADPAVPRIALGAL